VKQSNTFNCRFCGGPRPTRYGRCRGCAMEVSEARQTPEPPGKRACPMCAGRVVRWIDDNSRLECTQCVTIFEPLVGSVKP